MERAGGPSRRERRIALIFDEGVDALTAVLATARRLRDDGLAVSLEARGKRLGAQLAALERHGFDGFAVFDGAERPEVRWFGDQGQSREVSGSR
jgi:hypothetical protein